jgi:hypothetical protein
MIESNVQNIMKKKKKIDKILPKINNVTKKIKWISHIIK